MMIYSEQINLLLVSTNVLLICTQDIKCLHLAVSFCSPWFHIIFLMIFKSPHKGQ